MAFNLWIERAESEYLNGNFDQAEGLIAELMDQARSKADKVAAYRLRILLHLLQGEFQPAVDRGLECLRIFGIDLPAHPTREEVHAEYEKIWKNLGDHSIESLLDLPLMTDPEIQAAMGILSVIAAPAFNADVNLMYFVFCQMVNASLEYGTTGASAHGYAEFATLLGPVFHRYRDGYRFGKLAGDLIEKYDSNPIMRKYISPCRGRCSGESQSLQRSTLSGWPLKLESKRMTRCLPASVGVTWLPPSCYKAFASTRSGVNQRKALISSVKSDLATKTASSPANGDSFLSPGFQPRDGLAFRIDLVPQGRCDRSLARSAWENATPKEPSRRVRYDSCRYALRFDDWSDEISKTKNLKTLCCYMFWPAILFRSMANTFSCLNIHCVLAQRNVFWSCTLIFENDFGLTWALSLSRMEWSLNALAASQTMSISL